MKDIYYILIYKNRHEITLFLYVTILLLYLVFFAYSLYFSLKNNIALIVGTTFVLFLLLVKVLRRYYGFKIQRYWGELRDVIKTSEKTLTRALLVFRVLLFVGVLIFAVADARHEPSRLISVLGLGVILLSACLMSGRNISRVPWSLVLNCLNLQLVLALVILRWRDGYRAFQWIGDQFTFFLRYADVGARFVFGDTFLEHWFVMQSMPVVCFYGAVFAILSHFGILQSIIVVVGTVIQFFTGAGHVESFVAASNIFLGPAQAVLAVRRFLAPMTMSELHTVLAVGFASMSGSVLALYVSFGVNATQLLTASVMSAPAALAVSKIICPETEKSQITDGNVTFHNTKKVNVIAAASAGASETISIVTGVTVNMLAFLAAIAFLNATLSWFGARILCSYLFLPLTYLMGVEWADCMQVGQGIGSAIFVNSFLSYLDLSTLIRNRSQGLTPTISVRSEVIATYAYCNFANVGSVGMNLGALGAMVPGRRADLAQLALSALLVGNMASWMTACVAGLLYAEV